MNTQNSVSTTDWHPADVIAELRKSGTSLRAVGKKLNYTHVQAVLTRPWWAVEQLVAQALNVPAEVIWPSRYAPGVSREHAKRLTRNAAARAAATRIERANSRSKGGRS